MSLFGSFSMFRVKGLIVKEFRQLIRDHSTFAMIIGLPIVQLTLFGLAINTNPKHLPAALVNFDNGPFSRTIVHELENTQYFNFNYLTHSNEEADHLIATHKVLFSLSIPSNFSRQLVRGERPQVLLEVDGTDPVSVAYAMSAASGIAPTLFQYDLIGPLNYLNPTSNPADFRVHVKYNPSAITQYNVVPGLLGLVLTMTFVMVASMALTRERELGTMESLLATPLLPMEVIIGKAIPFLVVGYAQVCVILTISILFYRIPFIGNPLILLCATLPFILANLFVGIFFSTLAKTQLEASQASTFFFLPSLLLSGFAFPFKGMPAWAQFIGNILPLTHFHYIVRGVMLKGITFEEAWVDLWPILIFMCVMFYFAVKRYRRTLD